MRAILGSLLAAAILAAPKPVPSAENAPRADGVVNLAATYDGVLLIKVLDMSIEQRLGGEDFSAEARLRSYGVLSLLNKIDVVARTRGEIGGKGPRPAAFNHVNLDGKFNRRVAVNWTGEAVTTDARPAYPDMGAPAATPAQKLAAADPLTQLTRLAIREAAPCAAPMRFFDGRQLYEVAFSPPEARPQNERERLLGLEQPIRCALAFREVAGFDPKPADKKNQGLKGPLVIEFAQTPGNGPWVVYAVRGNTPLGEARIELRKLTVKPA